MPGRANLVGMRFGRLLVVKFSHIRKNKTYWLCQCDCGKETIAKVDRLKNGMTKSCGCLAHDILVKRNFKHGEAKLTPEYNTWENMKKRCTNKRNAAYKYYGARGIKICKRWLTSYKNFISDMGRKPFAEYSLDRINNDGNYEPINCRWADAVTQSRNRRGVCHI